MRNKPKSSREGAREGQRGKLRSLTPTRGSPESWVAVGEPAVLAAVALLGFITYRPTDPAGTPGARIIGELLRKSFISGDVA